MLEPPTHRGEPQYAGEDTRVTSSKELAGWYCYAFAAEVFVVCGMGKVDCWFRVWPPIKPLVMPYVGKEERAGET